MASGRLVPQQRSRGRCLASWVRRRSFRRHLADPPEALKLSRCRKSLWEDGPGDRLVGMSGRGRDGEWETGVLGAAGVACGNQWDDEARTSMMGSLPCLVLLRIRAGGFLHIT